MEEQSDKLTEWDDNQEPVIVSVEQRDSRRPVRKSLMIVGICVLVYLIYSVIHLFVTPDHRIQQIYLIPDNAAFIMHSSNPLDDWKQFSQSDTWKALKKIKALEETGAKAERLDSIVLSNKNLLSLVGKRDMLISIHKTRVNDWDCLLVLDMQKASRLELLKEQIELILRLADYTVTQRTYEEIPILEMRNPKTREILYAAFVDNHFVASYTSRLVEASISVRKNPGIGLQHSYMEAEKGVAGKGLYRLFINYNALPDFLSIYLGEKNEYIDIFTRSMDFAGLYFHADNRKIEMKGNTFLKEVPDPYITALFHSGKHKMKAHEIMSARTALYTHIGFSNMSLFIKQLEQAMAVNDKELYTSYTESRTKIEKNFGISLEENFLSWMSGELAISQSEPGLLGREPEYILAIGTSNIKDARKHMEFIEKKIKARTPIRVKTVTYKNFDVNYIEMKGFFRLFFGGVLDKFEKPYYTYIGDYVVFSNQASSLLSFIEDYEQKNLLKDDPAFQRSLKATSSQSTLFLYTDIPTFFPQLQTLVNAKTCTDLQADKNVLYSFPYWTMQIVGDKESASLFYNMDYIPYIPVVQPVDDPDKQDGEMNENASSERELMKELQRFYIEKFQGNVLREFYEDGSLRSETEIREGKRHGRHREYYENGKLKIRGKYTNNLPKGTWKYYSEDGKFERKEKF